MYNIDQDYLQEIKTLPQMDTGAPAPLIIASEGRVALAYSKARFSNGGAAKKVQDVTVREELVLVFFEGCMAHYGGPPNDEALSGHPLAERGLESYAVFEVKNSSWIKRLEYINRIHPHHDSKCYFSQSHLIFTFHDSTFEIICRGFHYEIANEGREELIPRMLRYVNRT